ncbi:2-polyprenyl-3-methyl-5-hydroxy-6-metoxy-1,4-benzoquinol methylase [Clavibacter sp. B3I6]|uniref:class I SAM-dependent methyltransferase n=1 Tax=Clavibacter sp. B3I6 TaxID=3042268 RepID=UPI0027867854|nr:class I SAM-dependent methyltransferase [Clavibacter sp. B3I6]MDQ0743212.1 2-polyprenyl-3-methyl-5-hydroxy-6-metoxy-1,4-benzoquinol methylase [Clavibacter sp. B3I6]
MDLSRRDTELTELMDAPDCDPDALARTYARFALVNRVVAGWRGVYRSRIRPLLSAARETTLLDIGSGGGDVPLALARWARRDGLRLRVTGIDPDPRAAAYARALPADPDVRFLAASSAELVAEGRRFDLVTSNHVLHHLDEAAFDAFLADSAALAPRALHSDIARGRVAYAAYGPLARTVARGSFVHVDGLRSIRRSWRPVELALRVPPGWRVEGAVPFRVLLVRDPGAGRARR